MTVHGRLLIVERHQQGWKQAHIAAAMGISRTCVRIWLDRYLAEGEPGLVTRSSRPRSSPTRTRPEVEAQVVAIRRQQRCGREEISAQTGVPAGGGWRGRGELVSNDASKKDKTIKVGFDFVHSLVDDHTRLTYSEVLPDEQGATCAGSLPAQRATSPIMASTGSRS